VITLADGRELIDGIASWWTACHGYNHPHILGAMRAQLETMPHVMFGGLVHEPALRLSARLAQKAPGDLSKVFFVDSGSVAVEVAMKMAVQYWLNRGFHGRSRMVSFRYGYHGDTMACMAVCDPDESMHALFKDYLPKQFLAELPVDEASAEQFDALLGREKDRVAAVLIEPLVQGAGGMKMHDSATLRRVAEICRKHEALLIADEIFVGFGRAGTFFACEQAGVVPDILCVGKGLTGGAVSLAATLARPHVFEAFLSDDPARALMHGPTYMANPLACAAANASLDLFEREPRLEQVAAIEAQLREELEPCRGLPGVIDVRVIGAIGAVQLESVDGPKLRHEFAHRLSHAGLHH
jgi:adenosylmethionine-8-amino-7-oxononanoate aminotransferase